MKKKILLLLLITNFHSYAQYTLIPDVNFEKSLIYLGIDKDIVVDGQIPTEYISSITTLNLSLYNQFKIKDLTGIQDFVALKDLNCSGNYITSLDISKNLALTSLDCDNNQIVSLDISKNSTLTILSCFYNQISTLDISKNLALTSLDCSENQLTTLDVSKNLALIFLQCSENQLKTLDVSKNLALNFLQCSYNQLTTLDVSENLALTFLSCDHNQISTLDTSKNIALSTFNCTGNQIENLDVSKNISLTNFSCMWNKLLSLNLKNSKNTLLVGDFKNNPQLTCIQVDDVTYSNSNWNYYKDEWAGFSMDCSATTLIPDINFEKKLISLGIDSGIPDGKVTTASIWSQKTLNVSSSNIEDMTGIQDFLKLTNLDCKSNQLANIDLSNNITLAYLNCSSNQLTSLNLSKNITLTDLDCSSNQLTNIDLLENATLTDLDCSSNQLTSLDATKNTVLKSFRCNNNFLSNLNLKNGQNILLSNIDFRINPNLTCILVDNVVYSNNNWTNFKDPIANYVPTCGQQYTIIPDANFEKKLISLGIDAGTIDGAVLTSSISSLNTLNVFSSSIKDLTGIQDFVALTTLYCHQNQIANLDISNNKTLVTFSCSSNQLTNLDISKNLALTSLSCGSNQIGALDISKNLALKIFSCISNQISNLDVSKNIALTQLQCSNNQLKDLDVSKNINLTIFNCGNNKLLNLNLKNGNNINLDMLNSNFINNPNLTCIQVDNEVYSNTNWTWRKDATASFSVTCNLGLENSISDKITIYPNPTNGQLCISQVILEKATVYNALGQLVAMKTFISGSNYNTIDLEALPRGIYYLYLESEGTNVVKKIMVE
jgi:Leucine-rich repeat (LRR) protein